MNGDHSLRTKIFKHVRRWDEHHKSALIFSLLAQLNAYHSLFEDRENYSQIIKSPQYSQLLKEFQGIRIMWYISKVKTSLKDNCLNTTHVIKCIKKPWKLNLEHCWSYLKMWLAKWKYIQTINISGRCEHWEETKAITCSCKQNYKTFCKCHLQKWLSWREYWWEHFKHYTTLHYITLQ